MANTSPIFSAAPDVQVGGAILGPTALNSTQVMTDSAMSLIFQAGANGSYVDTIYLKPVNSPGASVARIFICLASGTFVPGTTNTVANTALLAEITLPAITASTNTAQIDVPFCLRRAIPANAKLLIGFGQSTGAAGTGYTTTTFAGDY